MHVLVAGGAGSVALPQRKPCSARLVASCERIKRELEWMPQHDNLRKIISSAWDWHKSHPNGYEDK
jgi:UDP-glucose 4-epimerase